MKRSVVAVALLAALGSGALVAEDDSLEKILAGSEPSSAVSQPELPASAEAAAAIAELEAQPDVQRDSTIPTVGNPPVAVAADHAAAATTPPAAAMPAPQPVSMPVVQQPVGPSGGITAGTLVTGSKQEILTPDERAFAGQEERLLRDIRLAQLQKALMEERAGIAEAQREMLGENTPAQSASAADLNARTNPSIVDLPPPEPFHLVSIWGDPGNLSADLFVNGLRVTTRQGDEVAQGWRIAKIEPTRITAVRGKERKVMPLGTLRK